MSFLLSLKPVALVELPEKGTVSPVEKFQMAPEGVKMVTFRV